MRKKDTFTSMLTSSVVQEMFWLPVYHPTTSPGKVLSVDLTVKLQLFRPFSKEITSSMRKSV